MPVYKNTTTGKWYYDFKKTINGIQYRKRKLGFKTKIEATRAEIEMIESLSVVKHKPSGDNKLTFDIALDMYLKSIKSELKFTTWRKTANSLYVHILPFFSGKILNEIAHADIIEWKSNFVTTDLSTKFMNSIIGLFKRTLIYFNQHDYLKNQKLILELKPVKIGNDIKEREVWSIEEFNCFIEAFDLQSEKSKMYHDYFLALFYSGMRPNEFRALMVKDVQGLYLNVDKTLDSKNGGDVLYPPKNKSSIRKVLMPSKIINVLNDYCINRKDDDYLFGGEIALRETNLRRILNNHAKASKVKTITLHGFRHSHATLLIRSGTPIKVVSKRLGHSDTSTTMNTYLHLFKEDESIAVNNLDLYLIDF